MHGSRPCTSNATPQHPSHIVTVLVDLPLFQVPEASIIPVFPSPRPKSNSFLCPTATGSLPLLSFVPPISVIYNARLVALSSMAKGPCDRGTLQSPCSGSPSLPSTTPPVPPEKTLQRLSVDSYPAPMDLPQPHSSRFALEYPIPGQFDVSHHREGRW